MARLNRTVVEARETFLKTLFQNNPDLSMPAANRALFDKFGSQMRAARVYELRALVKQTLEKKN